VADFKPTPRKYTLVPDVHGDPGGVVLYGDKEIGAITRNEEALIPQDKWFIHYNSWNKDDGHDCESTKKRAFKVIQEEHAAWLRFTTQQINEHIEGLNDYG
jgi:hypothetical protein